MPVTADRSTRRFETTDIAQMTAADRTVLVVVDVQHDFAHADGAMGRFGLDLSYAAAAIDRIETLIEVARRAGIGIVFARVQSRPETDTRALRLFMQRSGRGSDTALAICRHGTPGAAYHRVVPQPDDLQIDKTLFSSFVGTTLDETLQARGIDTLVLCGLTTDCCVDCTARDAFHRDYNVFVVENACAAYDIRTHLAAIHGLSKNVALMVGTEELLAAWSPGGRPEIVS